MTGKRILSLALLLSIGLSACQGEDSMISSDFEIPEGPKLQEISAQNAPIYFYLFTHTEDHINHELSEERYWRGGEALESLAEENPEANLSWTIEFMGADAKTVYDRNSETGLVDYLLGLSEKGLVEFGYHAHHDPTYTNRPQSFLKQGYSWQEAYEAMHTWITCEKDPLFGGCVEEAGGGLQAVYNAFGEVEVVSGTGLTDGMLIERSAGAQAIRDELPDRWLGFGFPNHGAVLQDQDYITNRKAFMSLFTPTGETSSGTMWIDNSIKINDDATVEGAISIDTKEGVQNAIDSLKDADRSAPIVLNVGYVSKYMYTKTGTSPTRYGYVNTDSPELPTEWLNSRKEKELLYKNTIDALTYLVEEFLPSNEGSTFVNSDEVVSLFTSDDFWNLDQEELYQLSLWMLNHWESAPPNYAYDGEDFYSLTDTFYLLINGLRGDFPDQGIVSMYWGPWTDTGETPATLLNTDALEDWAKDFDKDQIPDSIQIDGEEWSPAQILYALALLYASNHDGVALGELSIPRTQNLPESYDYLSSMGCSACVDTSWSLKPARFQD